jgi:hypothetical protein
LAEQVLALLNSGDDQSIGKIHRALPADFAPRFITHYAQACTTARQGDVLTAHHELCQAVRIGMSGQRLFSEDRMALRVLYGAIQQAFAIDPKHASLVSPPPPVHVNSTKATSPLVLASCNGIYFERFGPAFLASAASFVGLRCHVHVVNPTEQTEALFGEAKKTASAELSLSCDEGPADPSYYACKRFLIAGRIMDRFDTDLIITDIDTVLMPGILDLLVKMDSADGGLFEREARTAPMEICHCSLSVFRRTESARRFLQLLALYLLPKLEEYGVWMLDQSALFTLSRLAMRKPNEGAWLGVPPFQWLDLSQLPKLSLEDVNPNQPVPRGMEEKHALRGYQSIGDVQISIAADGRPSFSRH